MTSRVCLKEDVASMFDVVITKCGCGEREHLAPSTLQVSALTCLGGQAVASCVAEGRACDDSKGGNGGRGLPFSGCQTSRMFTNMSNERLWITKEIYYTYIVI